jgi:alpha-beta hydrolase superfamily lysophospholipase
MAAAGYTLKSFTASDGYCWKYRHYAASGKVRARVVCVHGIQSHSGWYEHSCTRMAAAGFAVSFLDRRGAGMNDERRGDAPGFRRLLDDIAEYLRASRRGDAHLPTFLLAVSWGGKLAVALPKRHPGLVDALALLCPGFCPRISLPPLQRLGVFAARLVAPRLLFSVPLSDPALFTGNLRWREFIAADRLALRRATARFFVENVRLDGYLHWAREHIHMPVLLLLAEHDCIIDNARTRRFTAHFPTTDQQVIDYPRAHHTLEFEPDPEPFLADLLHWLDRQTAARTGNTSRPV